MRLIAIVGIVVLAVLATRVLLNYGWYAAMGAVLVVGIMANLWWALLRPKLVVGTTGLEIVSAWKPAHIPWKDVQRVEVGSKGTLVVSKGGQETHSRYPAGPRSKSATEPDTEADRAAVFLAACAAWGRRGVGPMPTYVPPTSVR
jgi:hypothetical protein